MKDGAILTIDSTATDNWMDGWISLTSSFEGWMGFFQSHLDSTATEPLILDVKREMSEEYAAGSMHSPLAMRSVTERTADCTLPHGEASHIKDYVYICA